MPSQAQLRIGDVLAGRLNGYEIHENHRPEWMQSATGGRLELDFYIEELGIAFEVQGRQHFEFVPFFHKTYYDFECQQERDEEKRSLCLEAGITLYEVVCPDEIVIILDAIQSELKKPKSPEVRIEMTNKLRYLKNATAGYRMRVANKEREVYGLMQRLEKSQDKPFQERKVSEQFEQAKKQYGEMVGKLATKIVGASENYDGFVLPKLRSEGIEPGNMPGDPFKRASTLISMEARRAVQKYPPFNSPHEAYAVLLEEVDEMWDAIKKNNTAHAINEAIQVGAMALRFVSEFRKKQDPDLEFAVTSTSCASE